ncbi:Uncharacterised protein [Mycobacterium tuberculosis]|nr:Uncharacterised protein [Mycobacterium tuberculosis]
MQHRRVAQNVAEHLLLPADAQAQRRPTGCGRCRAPSRHCLQLPGRCAHAVRRWQGWTAQQRDRVGPVPNPGDRHGIGVCHVGRVRYLPPAAFRTEGGQCQRPGPLRRQHRGQHRRSAHPQGGSRQRDCGDGADRRLFAWPQPSGWAGFGGQDRHYAIW